MSTRIALALLGLALLLSGRDAAWAQPPAVDDGNFPSYGLTKLQAGPRDWPQLGGTSLRNNTPHGTNIPAEWSVPVDYEKRKTKNIKWSAALGSQTYGSPVVADGRVFVGTNNGGGYVPRFPADKVDLNCLLCFDEQTGRFLWQHSVAKHPAGRTHDWP